MPFEQVETWNGRFPRWKAVRFEGTIVPPQALRQLGDNINGPSLIRVPDWLPGALGRYYLYFAHHSGDHIRLAFADELTGPWTLWRPGTLHLSQTPCPGHIASPDVHVDEDRREIRMYYHGYDPAPNPSRQVSLVARSKDGLHFESLPQVLGDSYFRVQPLAGSWLAMARGGRLYRAMDELGPFQSGPNPFASSGRPLRHVALRCEAGLLTVFHSRIGDAPEHIQVSHIPLTEDWTNWIASDPESLLWPEKKEEGAEFPVQPSVSGPAWGPVRQLRDPAYFREGEREYLLYSLAGECGIGLARLLPLDPAG